MAASQDKLPASFGWVGLGAMGYPMAQQLRRKIPKTSILWVYDIDTAAATRFLEEETQFDSKSRIQLAEVYVGSCSRDIAEKSEFIITIVPEGSHVRSVYLDKETGLLSAADTSRKHFVDCSTIDIVTSLSVGNAVRLSSQADPPTFHDAPVSGGTPGASAGTLTFMVGIEEDSLHLPLLWHIFSFMGKSLYALGGPSLGLAAKLSNNYLSGVIALATSEAMNLGMRLGLDPKVLSDCFATSSGGSWVNSTVNPVPGVCPDAVTSKGYEGGFKVQLMKKDMSLAITAAREVGAKLVLANAGLSAYTAAADDPRCRDRDSRVIYRWLGGVEPDVKR
ncbi:putative 3-hydroxyisobutyrate dehydrogenase, mitochondrial [Leucoagaricus sp. SymC.cos]|nr:putative 3-hydroxyisobutyrate dehydrogenase, mitochondrial [Leucoagaricus sp. SymC.cos]